MILLCLAQPLPPQSGTALRGASERHGRHGCATLYRCSQHRCRAGEIIRCPWHLWEFDIATGRCLVDAEARVKTYPVSIENGDVIVYADLADLPPQP